jgi:hypothetical protein
LGELSIGLGRIECQRALHEHYLPSMADGGSSMLIGVVQLFAAKEEGAGFLRREGVLHFFFFGEVRDI